MIKTSQETLDAIVDRLYDYNVGELSIRTDYSGRGMYRKECIGFVVDKPTQFLMALTVTLFELADPDCGLDDCPDWHDLRSAQDSMGLSTIVYFPNWQVID